jgi:hypothetical protein
LPLMFSFPETESAKVVPRAQLPHYLDDGYDIG